MKKFIEDNCGLLSLLFLPALAFGWIYPTIAPQNEPWPSVCNPTFVLSMMIACILISGIGIAFCLDGYLHRRALRKAYPNFDQVLARANRRSQKRPIKVVEISKGKTPLCVRAKMNEINCKAGALQIMYSLAEDGLLAEPYRSWASGFPTKEGKELYKYNLAVEELAESLILFSDEIKENGHISG